VKRIALVWLTLLFCLADPIPTPIYHPARIAFYAIYPDDLSTKTQKRLILAETNDYEKEDPLYYLDYELTSVTLIYQKELDEKKALRFILPIHYVWGGFMDAPLDLFHEVTGTLHDYEHNEDGQNHVHIIYGEAYRTSDYLALGNIELEYKRRISPDLALKAGLKFPTAKRADGFGSSKIDLMAGLIARRGPFSLEIDATYLGKATFNAASTKRFVYYATLTYTRGPWSVDYRFASSPFNSPYPQYDSVSNAVDVAYTKGRYTFFVSENMAPFYNTPDFTFGVIVHF